MQFPALQAWVAAGKPVWGTCAGMILLANEAEGMKEVGVLQLRCAEGYIADGPPSSL